MGHSHSICVFDSNRGNYWQTPVYKKIEDHISDGYAVIYILENDVRLAAQQMSNAGIKVKDHIESGALTIISNDAFYSAKVDKTTLLNQWLKVFGEIEKKNGRPRGFVAMGMPANMFYDSLEYQNHIMDYESIIAKNYDGNVEALCVYTTRLIKALPLSRVIQLLNSHQSIVHAECTLKQWDQAKGPAILERGLTCMLGTKGTQALLKGLKLHYKISEDELVLHSPKLEAGMRAIIGVGAADKILEKIKSAFEKEIAF